MGRRRKRVWSGRDRARLAVELGDAFEKDRGGYGFFLKDEAVH